jgi:uroporphyrinogen decarboxylase
MNGRQRINTVMRRGQPDRVPVWCLLSLEHILRHGAPDGALPQTIEELIAAECSMTRHYHSDGLVIYLPGYPAGARVDDWIRSALGSVPVGDPSHMLDRADPEQWEPDVAHYTAEQFYSSRLARETLGENYHIGGWTPDGFSSAIQWFPRLEEALVATIRDPARFQALVRYFDRVNAAWARAQVMLGGLESIQISSPYSGSSFVSPALYRRMVLPSVQYLANAIRDAGGFSYLHTCGFISDRLELMAETGVDGIECMDPPPLGDVTLAQAKARVGDRLFLKGNLDSVNILLQGTDAQVDEAIRQTVLAGKPGGGFVLSSACSVAPSVPPERIQRIWELAEELGHYT